MPNLDEIYSKVTATLVEALNVDEDDIRPTSTLQGDLGAESIDFRDNVLPREREFGIKIPRGGELFPTRVDLSRAIRTSSRTAASPTRVCPSCGRKCRSPT